MLLDGLRVVDLTDHRGEVGPWYLGRLGADVVKVEPPGGSAGRSHGPFLDDGTSLQFSAYNDNKRSIVLDPVASPTDRDTLGDLVAWADIVFDVGPPGSLAGAGFDESVLAALNAELVRVLITPFGADGPRASQPATEITLAALGGPMSLQGVRERSPIKISIPQVWRHTGSEAANAALVALRRARQGLGPQWVDVSAQAAMTWTMLNAMEAHAIQGFDFQRAGSTVQLAVSIDLNRKTTDGYCINAPIGSTMGPLMPWLIEEGIAEPHWADQDWTTYDHRALSGVAVDPTYDDLTAALDRLCQRYSRNELLVKGLEYGATFAPVNTIPDLTAFDHLERRAFWSADEEGCRRVGHPLIIDGDRPATSFEPPILDQHGDEIRAQVGGNGATSSSSADVRSPTPAAPTGGGPALPLAGIKVADFSWIGVGPITAKALADHGATVIRVETEKRLDTLRVQAPFKDGEFGLNRSNFYGSFNTSKWSLSLGLDTEAGLGIARRLTDWADVVIDSFRPGTMDRHGLGPEAIRAANPGAVVVTTSLLGGGGPLSGLAGYGFHAAAIAGFTDLVGWPDLPPDGPWMAYTDTIGPRFLTAAILAALERRDRTGEGCTIEGAQLEMGLQYLAPEILDHSRNDRVPTRRANREIDVAPQGAYPCAGDDEWCAISVPDDATWRALVEVIGSPSWARVDGYASAEGRLAGHDAIDEALSAWTAQLPAEEVERRMTAGGVPAGKVARSADLAADPQYLHRRFYRLLEHGEVGEIPYAGHQYHIRGYDNGPRFAAPTLGQHTFEVLTDVLGMDTDEVAAAAAEGALE